MKVDGYVIPENIYYTKEHVWLFIGELGTARIGVTDYAQKINFVYLPEVGSTVKRLQPTAIVESSKGISDLLSPLSGEVIDVNARLDQEPWLINIDPYGEGWVIIVQPSNFESEEEYVMKSEDYGDYLRKLVKVDKDLLIHRWKKKKSSPLG